MWIVGISGPSCSGKTTLARHLRKVIKNAEIMYMDDWYKPEKDLPLDENGNPDWDIPESFDIQGIRQAISDCKTSGTLPNLGITREEFNNQSPCLLTPYEINELSQFYYELLGDEKVLLVDGLFLFDKTSQLESSFDLKIICPVNYSLLKARREARKGYTTDAGFWQDPPNYFETHVWNRFLEYNRFLYSEDFKRCSDEALQMGLWMSSSMNMPDCLRQLGLEWKTRLVNNK